MVFFQRTHSDHYVEALSEKIEEVANCGYILRMGISEKVLCPYWTCPGLQHISDIHPDMPFLL